MDLDYDALFTLDAVIRLGSFEAAAKSLGVTQSAVSQRVKLLEERMGSILVVRGKPCTATEYGLLLCQHVEHVGLMEHELLNGMSAVADNFGIRGASIRISVNNDSLATWFPKVIARASTELNIKLEVIPDDQEYTEDRLRSGDALAIVTTNDTPVAGAELIPLGNMVYNAVASQSFFQHYFGEETLSLSSLSLAPTVVFDRKDTLPDQWLGKALGETAILPTHYVPSYEGILLCCRQGIGWVMMPSLSVRPLIDTGELVELVPGISLSVPLLWQCRSSSGQLLSKLTEIVKEVCSVTLD